MVHSVMTGISSGTPGQRKVVLTHFGDDSATGAAVKPRDVSKAALGTLFPG